MADPYAFQSSGDRGLCPVCDRSITITKAGVMRHHRSDTVYAGRHGYRCNGTGQKPKEN